MQGTGTNRSCRAASGLLGLTLALLLPVTQAAAFDPGKGQKSDDPWAAFRFGFDAYRSGDKKEAVEAYRYAADKGHAGAQWKLARMYADGDGVSRNEYEAFKIFRNIVQMGAEPGSPNESYVSDALVALAGYVRRGIPQSPIRSDPRLARDLYLQAASMFGNPDAQYEMGKMLLEGDGGRSNRKQAARWLRLSARKGHYKAEALLGDLLVQDGKMVRGLAMLTAALERAQPADQVWIRTRQEEAFGLAAESDRRTAMVLAEQFLREGYK